MSNLGTEQISDCFQDNIGNNDFKVTYADMTEKEGKQHPRETSLTPSEDFGL